MRVNVWEIFKGPHHGDNHVLCESLSKAIPDYCVSWNSIKIEEVLDKYNVAKFLFC